MIIVGIRIAASETSSTKFHAPWQRMNAVQDDKFKFSEKYRALKLNIISIRSQ
jgi:hypothetical protein